MSSWWARPSERYGGSGTPTWSNSGSRWQASWSSDDWSGQQWPQEDERIWNKRGWQEDNQTGDYSHQDEGRSLKRRATEEGRTLESYTYLGGDGKASLPLPDKVKILHGIFPDLGILALNGLASDTLDAAIWRVTGQQPTMCIRTVSVEPQRLREVFRDAALRRSARVPVTAAGTTDLQEAQSELEGIQDLEDELIYVGDMAARGFKLFGAHPDKAKRQANPFVERLQNVWAPGPLTPCRACELPLLDTQPCCALFDSSPLPTSPTLD